MSTLAWTKKRGITAILIAVLAILVISQAYLLVSGPTRDNVSGTATSSGSTSTSNEITVTGIGQVQVQPDRAILSIGVVTQASTAGTAVQENANTMSQVITALNDIGIANGNIRSTSYNIYAQTSCCTGPPTITGYQATNEVQVTIIPLGQAMDQLGRQAGQAIDVAAANGANQISGIQFTVGGSTFQTAHRDALEQASLDAAQQAHTIASALNVSITSVVSVTTSPAFSPPVFLGTASSAPSTPIIPPQSLTVTVTVQAVFSIS